MPRPWALVFAPLLVASPAVAQDLPVVPLPAMPPTVTITVPVPVPVVTVPAPAAPPAPYPAPPPATPWGWAPAPPPPLPPPSWSYAEMPPPEPPPQKRVRGVLLAVDMGAAFPIHSPDAKIPGFVTDFRVGYRFGGPGSVAWIAPIADLGWIDFPKYDWAFRFGAGAQVGLDAGLVEPSIYALGGGFVNVWKSGPGVRAGAALDFRPGRFLIPGVHVDYDAAEWNTGSVRFVSAGAHLGFLLGR